MSVCVRMYVCSTSTMRVWCVCVPVCLPVSRSALCLAVRLCVCVPASTKRCDRPPVGLVCETPPKRQVVGSTAIDCIGHKADASESSFKFRNIGAQLSRKTTKRKKGTEKFNSIFIFMFVLTYKKILTSAKEKQTCCCFL